MSTISLSSVASLESLGGLLSSTLIGQVRISPPEYSFSNSFSNDFAIGENFKLDKVVRTIINGSILSLEAFGNFLFPKIVFLSGVNTKEGLGSLKFNVLHIYSIGSILYIVDEAKNNRLEKVAIKNVIIQRINSSSSGIEEPNQSGSPYKNWEGALYSVLYEDTLERIWEEQELTTDPESYFDWYLGTQSGGSIRPKKVVSVKSLGKRKRNVDWTKSRLFSRRMAEKGILQRIKIKKASIRKGNILVYFDEKNNSWEENELVFEAMATMLIENFKKVSGKEQK